MSILSSIMRVFSKKARRPRAPTETIRAGYDAVKNTDTLEVYWSNADAMDADACNSLSVRQTLRNRSRLELKNNAYLRGIIDTHVNYVIGTGPKLRMQTRSIGFNQKLESDWGKWCAAIGFAHKLRAIFKADTVDGEGVARLFTNPVIQEGIQLDLMPIECDRLTAPLMYFNSDKYIDGVTFDEYGNPVSYDLLKRHPGAEWIGLGRPDDYDRVASRFVIHMFHDDRPGQHRGIPRFASSLNAGAQGRRYKEAVMAAAELAASLAALLKQQVPPSEDPDVATPFTTMPIEKGMIMALPTGAEVTQMKAEQPTTTYEMFVRSNIAEMARPVNMPYNIAACDNSNQNFSGGRLNHHTYFLSVDVERAITEQRAVEVVFAAWFREWVLTNAQSTGIMEMPGVPKHSWDWPAMPHVDDVKTANARQTSLAFGGTRLGLIYAEEGLDYEDELPLMAAEYGVSVDEMRARLLECNLPSKPVETPQESQQDESPEDEMLPRETNARSHNGFCLRN